MQAKAQKWGNSLAVRVPKAIAAAVGVRENDELDIEVAQGAIRLVPRGRQPKLRDLVRAIRPDNLHHEIDFGPRKGSEIW